MSPQDKQMIESIMDTDTMGYAYVYPRENGAREEYMLALTAENLANLIGRKGTDASKIIVTDVLDRLVISAKSGILDVCPDQTLCREVIGYLAPIQMGEQEAGELLSVNREVAEEYFIAEEVAATMAEYQMQ